jgi:hypothetical protein
MFTTAGPLRETIWVKSGKATPDVGSAAGAVLAAAGTDATEASAAATALL